MTRKQGLKPGTLVRSNNQYYFWNEIGSEGPLLQGIDPGESGAPGIILGYLVELNPVLAEKARFWSRYVKELVAVLIGDTVWYVDHNGIERIRKQQ